MSEAPCSKGRVIKIGGEKHRVAPLTWEDWESMQEWVDAQFPDPFEVASNAIDRGRLVFRDGKAAREPYPVAQQQHMLKVAMEQATRARHMIGSSEEADALLQSMEGIKQLLIRSVRKSNAAFSDADAARLFNRMNLVDIGRVFKETQADMVTSDPKDGPGPPPAGTP